MSVESSRKIKTSLFIVFLMVSMTWSIGINEIVSKYEPKSELPDAPVVVETSGNVGCDSATRTAGTPIYVDPVVGSNTWAGTSACPKASLEDALSISIAGDEIILNSGLYHENVTVNNKDDLLIRAADGAKVVFDGTRSIAEDFGAVWSAADGNGIQEVDLPQAGWQLFLAYEEQVPARWPNAAFDDETVFNRSYWAEGTLTSNNNAYTKGWLTDAGPETGVHSGLNETINATGLDPVGAIAILNLGSFRSNSREITGWNSANGTFSYDSSGVSWKNKHHAYFLEGKRELIDIDGEWWFDNANSRLHYKTPGGQDANVLDLRVKVQPFAISVDGSDGVTIQGIDFFGTTVNFNNCDGCSFTNATLEYPSTSKRGLGIAGESEDDRWMTRFYRCTNTFVDRISITNTDGGALEFHGSGGQSNNNIVNNSYFHAIDWTAADQKGLMTTIYEGGRDMYFTNNSVHLTGASSVLSIGDAPKVFYNDVWDVGHLQSDGAVVQVMQGEAPGAEIAYNWIHDIIKYGARFDAPIGQAGEGRNGTMHHNVIWNAAGGLMVKGDYHDIHNNTVFNSTGKNDIIFLTDGGINNKNSTLHYNAVDSMADHRSADIFANPIPYGTDWMNWNGYIQGKQDAVTALTGEINSGGWVRVGYTCIINSTKSLLCWGNNANGQLGLGNTTDQSSPVAVAFPNAGTVEKVADSGGFTHHNCAIMTNGSLYCWGMNNNGELGIGSTTQQTTPQLVNLGPGVKAVDVSVGAAFTCAVTDAGALMCWGSNVYGKLGIGNTSSANYPTPQTVNLPTNRKAVDVGRLGRHFGYALLDNGEVVSWGRNHVGYLGTGNTTTMHSPTVISLDSQRQVVSMSGGKHHGCIGYDNGSVVCAGRDNVGQQGRNSPSDVNDLTFSYTNALANLSIIALAGQYTSCALLANGTAQCWGQGNVGQMGDGTTGDNPYPDDLVNTPSGRFIVDMSMSGDHACIVLDDGSVACWGRNNKGQLGLGNTTNQLQPVVLTGLDDLSTTSVHEMLVDPANNDFRPKWGSHLHVLNAGAYDADDADPWTAGISWTYTTPNAPVAGCMLDYADNYDADAIVPDGSCLFSSYTPPSTLDLRLHLDPTNSSSYSGSGTDLVDLSTYGNDGTIDGAEWDANRTRFYYDGSCSGATAPANQAGTYVCDEVTFAETNDHDPDANGDWSVSVWINATTVQHSVIIGKWNGGGSASDLGYIIRIGSDNKLYTSVGTTSGSSAVSTSRISIEEDRWYHLVMVADVGNMLRLYADGVNVANASLSSSGSIRNTTSGISIGSYNAGEYNQPFDGNIGEVMVFADALNASNINQLYTAGKGVYSNTTNLSYAQSSSTLILGQAYSFPLTVANGEVTTSYSLSGTLPSGMNFESSNGTIWGTPTAGMASTTYTVTANNSAGSYSASISLTSQDVAPYDLAYSPENMTLEKGTTMMTNAPSVSGGAVTSWEISPSLPTGLSFGSTNGSIWGTPTIVQATAVEYTIWANNSGGSTSATVNITVNDVAPLISYSLNDIIATFDIEIDPHSSPTNIGGAVTSWEISPDPGPAFHFNQFNGVISGTPGILLPRTEYTIYANNSGGSSEAYVNVTINDVPPNTIIYSPHTMTLEKDTAMSPVTPTASGGSVSTWEIAPDLPSGLSFDSATGTISGTPTVLQLNSVAYTVWANNTGGSASTTVNIAINDQIAVISYSTPVEISNDRALASTITPTISGGAVTSWEISPSLPTGLIFGTTNGSIWGTPVGVDSDDSYTIWANNSGGSAQATLTLTLVWTLTPTVEGLNATRNTTLADDIQWTWDYEPLEAQSISLVTGDYNTCSIKTDSDIYCWGRNGNGQLGYGSSSDLGCGNHNDACKDRPRETIDLGTDVVSLAFGDRHACGLTDTGIVKCWGRNNHGQIGVSGGDKSSPELVSFGSGLTATSIYAGGHHTCAILSDGSVKCWGRNEFGQLGIGTTINTNTPTTVNTLGAGRSAISLALAWDSTCALLDDGSVKCWGKREHGQLGDGSSTGQISSPPSNPISFGAGRTAKMITAGEFHYCAILDNDAIMCWGDGANGKLATGNTAFQATPISPSGSFAAGRYAVYIDAGYHHTCAILDNGRATCWGSDANGQLGNGASTGDILSLHTGYLAWNAMAISAGGSHTCMQVDKPGDNNQHERIKCWGSRGSGQLGDNSNFVSGFAVSPQSVYGGFTALNTGITAPNYVNGATCEISPSLPAGLTLTPGDCSITGTPTVTAVNTTYTVWANITGQSFSGQFWLEVGLNAPIISYSQSFYTFTIDATIAEIQPTNTGGEVTTWEIDPQSLPTGVNFGSANGTFWGTPTALETLSSHTVWANNSAGSVSFSIGFSVIDNPPIISYSETAITIVANAVMTPLTVTNTGGAIVSCTASPNLPNGLSLSNTCEISGTPTAPSPLTPYTITATNTGGSDSTSISITVQNSGGTLTITPTNTEGSVNSTISDITMSYTHTASTYAWASGVSTSTTTLTADWLADFGSNVYNGLELTHLLSTDIGPNGEQAIAFSRNVSSHFVLALMYEWNGVWTETIIDNNPNSAHHPSIAIDKFGAIHIAYIDSDNDILRYATNASGQWVLTTLGSATYDNDDHRGTAIVIHPVTNAVHIVTSTNDNTYRDLVHHTNETGSWVNTTITNTLSDEGHDPSMAMDSDGNIYVAYYCDDGCSDLRMSSRINGVWQNETIAGNVASSGSNWNVGAQSDIAIDSQDTIHIVSNYVNNRRVYLHSGTPGSWTQTQLTSGSTSWWPTIAIDSNDVLHVAYHKEAPNRHLMYMTNASGSWSTPIAVDNNWGGWGSDMVIDQNDDLFIAHAGANVNGVIYDYLKVTTVQGTGQGLTPRPIFTISPPLPDGLNMNWRSGTITGTPTEVHTNTTHTVTVTALGLTTTATFTLLITGAPGDIAYSDISGSIQAPITPTTPTFTNTSTSGSISTWEIDPSLPNGMNFGSNNGTIWGNPTVVVSGDVFTIWANNSVGSKSTTVTITIDDLSVSAIIYASENFILTYYHTMTATTPSTTGGTATSWSIHPSLPTGLSLDAATGEISGRPEVLQTTAVTYTVWANNSGGTFSDQINITINDHSPAPINYLTDELNLVVNQSVVSVSDFEIKPDLLAAGEDHTCAIDADGAVWCWGTGTSGQLGTGQTVNRWQPFTTDSLGVGRTAIDITAGGDHTCAVLDDGTVSCWGANAYGQLGDGTNTLRSSPTQTLPLGRPAVAVEASMFSTCALLDNGSVSCWGRNHQGQLGRGFSNASGDNFTNPPALTLPMPGGLKVVAIDISHYMKCGVLEDGSIACWGAYGGGNTPSLKTFFGAANPAKDVATGRWSACALMRNGSVNCWGEGFLGTGGAGQTANPGAIWPNLGTGRTAVQLELGRYHNCAILDDDSVKCWGKDDYGQVGNGAGQNNAITPSSVSFASGRVARDIIAGHWHTCVAMQTNEIYCWGDGKNGKLGDGSTNHNQAPGKTMHFDSANPAKARGDITSWEINASLPSGLTFGSNNGTIYGTATELWTQTSYTIWANNSGGSSVAYFNITVVDEVPTFSYSPDDITLTNNTASSDFPLAPTLTGAGVITSWEINASLPSGVSFGSNNGTIYGTPTELWPQTAYLVWGNNSGGSTVAYLNITVVDQLPSISYSPDELILTNNTLSSDLPLAPTLTGAGVITSWEINASLPSGVSFGSNNGTIYGTPTELWPQTAYRVWANNSGGSSVAYLNITVTDEIPTISYSPENLLLTKNIASTDLPLSPTLTGSGTITSWEISPSLPAGLNFGSSNGTIWGTPTSLQTVPITYTIYANNSGGSASANINITINDELPNIAYSPDWFELTKDTAMSPTAIPTNTGGAIPSAVVASGIGASYTSIAVDSLGFKHISYHVDSVKDLFYATDKTGAWTVTLIDSDSNGYTSIAIDSNDNIHISYYKNANGGELTYTTCSSSCSSAFSWTSTVVDNGQSFLDQQITIDANNALHISYYDGSNYDLKYAKCSSSCSSTSSWTTLLIDSDGQVGSGNSLAVDSNNNPHISYYDFINQNLKYATCSSSCELISSWTNTTLDTTGNVGSDTSIAIDSNDNIHIAYTGQFVINVNSLKYATDESGSWLYSTIETGTPSMSSGIENSIAIDSNDNIHISYYNSANGLNYATDYTGTWVISTLDTPRFSSTRYTDIAIDSGDKIHISYSATGVLEVRYVMADSTSNLFGYSISPNLPAGLNFNPTTGEISGTPTAISANTTYTITATNSGGSSTTTITIVVNDVAPSGLVYSVENMSLIKNQAMTPNTATVNGAITSWEISPGLPTGLSFGSSNGTIWGTPTVVQLTPIAYTVWANNTGGSVSVTLNITIADDLAVFSYPNSPYTIVRGYNMSDITPTVTSGTVVSWGIHPSLPSGLSFTNGVISGKPTGNQTITTYTVYANNSGGSATATLQLTINEPTPNVDYSPDNYTLTNGTSYTITPTLLGQTGNISSIMGAGTVSASGACTYGDLLIFMTNDWRIWAFNTSLSTSTSNPYVLATGASFSNYGSPSCVGRIVHNGTMYFQASTNSTGVELWRTDGTPAGTSMVKDIRSGATSSYPGPFFVFNDEVHFEIDMGINGIDIWKTNGTSSGTVKATNTVCYNVNCYFSKPIEYNGSFYATGYWNNQGTEVLMYNSSGLSLLVDLTPGQYFSVPRTTNPSHLTVYDGWFWFLTAGNPHPSSGNGNCLYRSNGTAAGTTPFVCDTSSYGLELFNDELYFSRSANGNGYQLWKTDGTTSGTVMVTDILAGGGSAVGPASARLFTSTDDYLYFSVQTGTANTDHAIWRTDGTNAGTQLIKSSFAASTTNVVVGDVLYVLGQYFTTNSDSITGLWSTDGTTDGTTLYTNYDGDSPNPTVGDFHNINGSLYIRYNNGTAYTYGQMHNAGQAIIGQPSSWSITPSLPTGLNFGTNNGTIWGTPTVLQITPVMYTITATNANGSSSTTINLTIIDVPPGTITYSPHDMILTKNELMTPNVPTIGGEITSWETYPTNLPPGLSFGANNGTIWGTPSIILVSPVTYTIWANNSGGSSTTTVNITINDQAPAISYSPDYYVFTINDTISPSISPTVTGGAITTWTINATLPTGVFFGPNNGTIYGVAGQLWPQHTYLITASNSGGASSDYLNITIIDELPTSISYPVVNLNLTNNTASPDLPMTPQIQGPGTIVTWEISAALPSGLFFNVNTGEISGIATELWPTTNYTVWANNSGGAIAIEFNITVVDQVPTDVAYNPSDLQLVNNTASTDLPLIPQLNGPGEITSWEINASLPSGIMFGGNNGTIWGTPTELWPTTAYQVWANNSGGSVSGYLNITVVDQVPTLSYSPDVLELTNNTASLDLPLIPQLSGPGEITSWEINAPLPNGILFGGNNGTIWGTPTELWPTTSYTVWSNNTGGSSSATLTITVVDQVPTDVSYSPSNLNFINNTASSVLPLSPQLTGPGEITSWEINATLPSGILFGGNNGTIWGTPTELWPITSYTIWANNSGGSVSTEINITVVDQVPSLAYNPSDLQLMNNTASVDLPLLPQLSGAGEILTWEINATLPSGISFGSNNGTFWGTPTELWPTTAYKVWANNTGGSAEAYLNITVVDQIPMLSYSPDVLELTNNTASSDLPLAPTLSGAGVITSWEINATLPSGVLFGSNNGTFYGIPTELWPATDYTVWANNSGGSVSTMLTITVVDQVPNMIVYPVINLNLTNNTGSADLPMIPQITGPGAIISWEISGAIPQGLSLDSNTGIISGIPTELWPTTNYTVWANNTGGSVAIEFNITVVDQLPTTFTYNPSDLLLSNNTASSDLPLAPQLAGPGLITSWAINETLPSGLQFGTNNGTIWGIPTEIQLTPKPFNITASNSGGTIYAIINITIVEAAPTLDYDPDNYTFIRNTTITDIVPIYTPLDLIDTWEISPALPNGLTLDNGTISGTPTVNMTITEFTVWANNTGGSAFANINITIVEPTGSFAYMPDDVNLTRGQGISPMSPNYNGGAIENWSIHPQLPAGLIFDNGTISGTPTVNSTKVNYTVYANNSGGSVTAFVSITINEPVASIIYVPDERNETRTISMTPWFPQVTGGEVETWEIYPALPNGLTFVDGIISGTATVNSTRTTYTVWANNSGGSASTTINLTVVEPVVQLSYPNYELILVRDTTMTSLMPQLSGGEAETWEIYPELPAGINFTDGMIWGTPAVNSTRTMYTVYANNTGGSTNVSLNITILEPSANIIYDPVNLILTRGEAMEPAIPDTDGGAIEEWGIHPELPAGLIFDNGTIYGTPTVNMTITNYIIYGNNSGGSSIAGLSITVLEPAPTITYLTDYLVLTRGEAMTSPLHAIFGGGAVASFTVTPDLPDGLNFTNGTIFGTPTVNSTIVEYNISAINNGGSDYFLLNITILEPVANLSAEQTYFELIRGEDEMNLTLNNTGGMVATWEIAPELPAGLIFGNGTITGTPTVNASLATYTIWANNTGGSDSILVNIRVLEPAANISYRRSDFTLINGQDNLYIAPDLLGGNPETWEFEPELPAGITFSNGVFSGVPKDNLTTTTFTVWANNSGGSATATITLTVDQPFFVVRYPVTILVLNISEDMPVLAPVYYFDETSNPIWSVQPALPDGLIFENGNISGIPTTPQPLTSYNVTVTGDLVPFTFEIMIEIRDAYVDPVIEDQRNETQMEAEPPETEFPEPEEESIAFWLCPLILIILLFLTAMLYNATKKNDDVEIAED